LKQNHRPGTSPDLEAPPATSSSSVLSVPHIDIAASNAGVPADTAQLQKSHDDCASFTLFSYCVHYCDACIIVVNFISAIAVARHSANQHLDKE